jgi:hypothetical protein
MLLAALQKNTESVVAIVVHSHRFADIEAFYVQQWQGTLIPTYGPAILTGHGTEMCVREQSNMCLQLLAGLMPDVLHNMSPNLVKQVSSLPCSKIGLTTLFSLLPSFFSFSFCRFAPFPSPLTA